MARGTETADKIALAQSANRAAMACSGKAPADTASQLAADGLIGVLVPEAPGGLDLGLAEAAVIAEAAGRSELAFPLVEEMLLAGLLASSHPAIAADVIAGNTIVTLAWSGRLQARRTDGAWQLHGAVARIPMARSADYLLAPADLGSEGIGGVLLGVGKLVEALRPTTDLEADIPYYELALHGAAVPAGAVIADPAAIATLYRNGSLLRAADMLGVGKIAFETACEYVKTRRQFGKPLAAFQSVKHRLARDHVGLLNTERSLAYAAQCVDEESGEAELACLVAAAVAGESCRRAAESAMHLHGAIGQTRDLPLHRYLRRIHASLERAEPAAFRALLADRLLAINNAAFAGAHPALS